MKRPPDASLAAYALALILAMVAVLFIASLPAFDAFINANLALEESW
jgi:hypothetical protein